MIGRRAQSDVVCSRGPQKRTKLVAANEGRGDFLSPERMLAISIACNRACVCLHASSRPIDCPTQHGVCGAGGLHPCAAGRAGMSGRRHRLLAAAAGWQMLLSYELERSGVIVNVCAGAVGLAGSGGSPPPAPSRWRMKAGRPIFRSNASQATALQLNIAPILAHGTIQLCAYDVSPIQI